MAFKKVNPRQNFPELEERILKFWKDNRVFEKSVEERPKEKTFSFYDGPPFATGLPHHGHLLAGTIKDVIPRFRTMQGYRVERVWGWDTHGLPIENIVEQEFDFQTKTHVQEYGVDRFNEKCRSKVLEYADEWEKIVERTGRWVDMKNAYLTMDREYMESVWWVFKTLWDKKLIYQGHKVVPFCPRCSTGLSNFEVGQAYKDKRDKTIIVKFEVEEEPNTYFLAWTTTPWTLPGNLALAIGKNIEYVKVQKDNEFYILAKERLGYYSDLIGNKIVETFKEKDLVGKKYKPVFDYYEKILKETGIDKSRAFYVIAAEFVSTEDGTGIVHIAPAFGEEDYRVAREEGIDFFMPVDDMGRFTIEVPDYADESVITLETNEKIIADLREKVVKVEEMTHAYPHCWRCDTPLIYKAIDNYLVAVEKLKSKMLKNNTNVKWMPSFVGKARFAKLIEGAPDWNISRNRFWGTPLPVWVCEKCKKVQVFGSASEVAKASGQKIDDLHLHFLEKVSIPCECGGKAYLSGEVLDCWFESGSMPYASIHYPFENKEKYKNDFPADFIAEGIDQTRGWFYSLLVLSTALEGISSYKSVVVNGTILAEDGQKMSKHLKNYPDPVLIMDKYGADAMRFYLMASPAVKAGDLNFSEKSVDEVVKKLIMTLWNSYSFFITYASLDRWNPETVKESLVRDRSVLDRWIISRRNTLVENVTDAMEKYDLSLACRYLLEFTEDLSNWYIRRSRRRFWKSEDDADKNNAYHTLYKVLNVYIQLLAPFMPFITEEIYQNLKAWRRDKPESVHLADWPKVKEEEIDKKLEKEMETVRQAIELGLSQRMDAGIKVRQPLAKLLVVLPEEPVEELKKIIAEEVNVKEIVYKKSKALKVELDTKITPELKAEGIARDFIRFIQDGRKKAGFNVEDRIETGWETSDSEIKKAIESQKGYITKETLSKVFKEGKGDFESSETIKLDGKEVWFGISRSVGDKR